MDFASVVLVAAAVWVMLIGVLMAFCRAAAQADSVSDRLLNSF